MNKIEQMERQEVYDQILNYKYFDENNGTLALEPFCVHLAYYLKFDEIQEKTPEPVVIYFLLLDLIKKFHGNEGLNRYVKKVKIPNWTSELGMFFPEKTATLIRVGGLIQLSQDWISDIGYKLLGFSEPETPTKYFDWVDEKWIFTFAFINRYHNAFVTFQKEIDRKLIKKSGYSFFEALYLSNNNDRPLIEVTDELKKRNDSYQTALEQIDKAINDKYFLEAISLQECLISHCIFNFLKNSGNKLKNPSFNELIKSIRSTKYSSKRPNDLFRKVDIWRENRNKSIHGYFTSDNNKFNQSRLDFQNLSSSTAEQGMELSKLIIGWYEFECVNFIKHEFPSKEKTSMH